MNKTLPIVAIVVLLLGVLGGGFFAFKHLSKAPEVGTGTEVEEGTVKELALVDRPYTTLVPGPSCEYTLSVVGIKGSPASVEYEIVYKNADNVTQGATGTMKPAGVQSVSKKILFGSESSGKRRCDPGVSGGTITLRYRNDVGKLLAKVDSQFALSEDKSSVSVGSLTVDFGRTVKGKYLAMGIIGLPGSAPGKVVAGPYGVFTNSAEKLSASVKISGAGDLHAWTGSSWTKVSAKTSQLSGLILATQ